MAMQPHHQRGPGATAQGSHHAAAKGGTKPAVHPQRKYVAAHLRTVANGVEHSSVAHAPMTPTERTAMRAGLKHAREHVAATPVA